jgi:hypothetical protein
MTDPMVVASRREALEAWSEHLARLVAGNIVGLTAPAASQ